MKYLRFLLFPFSFIYYLITSIRNFLYDNQILKSYSFSIPIITVGNLSVGGTGKTPQIEYLIALLKDSYKTAVLSRGYKRKSSGFLLINKDNTYVDSGDEPMQYFKKFSNISVAVDEKRARGIQNLLRLKETDVVLLDDAFQHRKVKGSYAILLTKYNDLFIKDFILPVGNLRESRRGVQRANAIVVTKCPENLPLKKQEAISKLFNTYNAVVFFSKISYASSIRGINEIAVNELSNYKVLLITGIANPTSLLSFLKSNNVDFDHLEYPDHHNFIEKDILKIKKRYQEIATKNKLILTTEKDFVRLEFKLNNLYYLPIKTAFLEEKQQINFDDLILSHIKNFK